LVYSKFTFDRCKTNAMHCQCSFAIFILDELFSEEDYKKMNNNDNNDDTIVTHSTGSSPKS